jgi:hypothetical protein
MQATHQSLAFSPESIGEDFSNFNPLGIRTSASSSIQNHCCPRKSENGFTLIKTEIYLGQE